MAMTRPSQDDFLDIVEMSRKMEEEFLSILEGNDTHLAMSALINALTRCIVSHSETIDDMIFYRNVIVKVLDKAIMKNSEDQMKNFS